MGQTDSVSDLCLFPFLNLFLCLPTMSVCQMISTYHDDLRRKLAERYQAPLGNHNILIYPEWQAFFSLTFAQGILNNGRAVYLFTPPPNQKVLVSPLITENSKDQLFACLDTVKNIEISLLCIKNSEPLKFKLSAYYCINLTAPKASN